MLFCAKFVNYQITHFLLNVCTVEVLVEVLNVQLELDEACIMKDASRICRPLNTINCNFEQSRFCVFFKHLKKQQHFFKFTFKLFTTCQVWLQ